MGFRRKESGGPGNAEGGSRGVAATVVRVFVSVSALLVCGVTFADEPLGKWATRYEAPDAWAEGTTKFPPLPDAEDLIEVEVDGASGNRYFVDKEHVTVGDDGVTRLTLVTQPRRGARIATYEGFRCETYESRVYAIANSGEWTASKQGDWRRVPTTGYTNIHGVLMSGAACDVGTPRRAEALVRNLRVQPRRVR